MRFNGVSTLVFLSTLVACSTSSERPPTGVFDPQTGKPYPAIEAMHREYEACTARAPNDLEYIKAHCIPPLNRALQQQGLPPVAAGI